MSTPSTALLIRDEESCAVRAEYLRLAASADQSSGFGGGRLVHAVDIDEAQGTLSQTFDGTLLRSRGRGGCLNDGIAHPVHQGSIVHIPPGVVHGAVGRMKVLVVGIPDIAEDDLFFPEANSEA